MAGTNTLAYHENWLITAVKSFITFDPVLHIFTDLPISIELLSEKISSKFENSENVKLAIFYDVRYHRAFESSKHIFEQIRNSNKSFSDILICPPSPESSKEVECGRYCPENLDENWNVLFVGSSEKLALLLALTFPRSSGHFMFDATSRYAEIEASSVNVKKALMKRYYLGTML